MKREYIKGYLENQAPEMTAENQYMETPAKNWEEEFEFDIAHRQGGCSYPSLALCSAEEQRIKQFIRQLLEDQQGELYAWFNKALLKQREDSYQKGLDEIIKRLK